MFGFAQPYQSRLGLGLQRAQAAIPAAPKPMFDVSPGIGGPGKFPALGGQTPGGGPGAPMSLKTAPEAADTASVTPVNAPPSFMPGLSSANPLDAAGGSADGAEAAGGADFADLLAAIFGA